MSVNSSSSLSPAHHVKHFCYNSTSGVVILSAYTATNGLLLFPLCALVLRVGFRRWRLQRAVSHADVFTYHMVLLEFFTVLGSVLFCVGNSLDNEQAWISGFYMLSMIIPIQSCFHCLTCIERYLAVVHPVTYLVLRKRSWIRKRNILISCIWLKGCGWMGVAYKHLPNPAIVPFLSMLSLTLTVISFCSLSVLWALRRPSPGDNSDRKRIDQSKQRAFHTIMVIVGALLCRFAGLLICIGLYGFITAAGGDVCVLLKSSFWFSIPSSLVLPVLFLLRAEKLCCSTKNTGQRSE